jgi:hypothetical protein
MATISTLPSARRATYEKHFAQAVQSLHEERRYRVFADIERIVGRFPKAHLRGPDGATSEITIWCSNDYLGMGQHRDVVDALTQTAARCGVGAGGTRNIAGNTSPSPLGAARRSCQGRSRHGQAGKPSRPCAPAASSRSSRRSSCSPVRQP